MDAIARNVKFEDIIKSLDLEPMNPMKKSRTTIRRGWIEYIKEFNMG